MTATRGRQTLRRRNLAGRFTRAAYNRAHELFTH